MTQMNIVNGPDKFDLMTSLFEGNPTPRKRVLFDLKRNDGKSNLILSVAITGIDQESGSGQDWIFRGYVISTLMEEGVLIYGPGKVKGYYSSRKRTGTLEFIQD